MSSDEKKDMVQLKVTHVVAGGRLRLEREIVSSHDGNLMLCVEEGHLDAVLKAYDDVIDGLLPYEWEVDMYIGSEDSVTFVEAIRSAHEVAMLAAMAIGAEILDKQAAQGMVVLS